MTLQALLDMLQAIPTSYRDKKIYVIADRLNGEVNTLAIKPTKLLYTNGEPCTEISSLDTDQVVVLEHPVILLSFYNEK